MDQIFSYPCSPWVGWVLPYNYKLYTAVVMCGPKGYGFEPFWPVNLKMGMDFIETGMDSTDQAWKRAQILEARSEKGYRRITYFGLK